MRREDAVEKEGGRRRKREKEEQEEEEEEEGGRGEGGEGGRRGEEKEWAKEKKEGGGGRRGRKGSLLKTEYKALTAISNYAKFLQKKILLMTSQYVNKYKQSI